MLPGESADVVLGVRPADVLMHAAPRDGATAARVTLLEPTGSDLWITTDWRGQRLKGRAAPGAAPARGATVYVEVPPERVYAFDRATQARLRAGA